MSSYTSSHSIDSDRHHLSRRIELVDSIESFRAWKTFIRNYLSGKNLLGFIDPALRANEELEEEAKGDANKNSMSESRKQRNEARSILFKTIHPTLFQLFEDEEVYPLDDPLKLYQGIVAHFEIASMTNKNHLRTQLYQSKMKSQESVDSYVSRIQQLNRSIKSIDAKWNPNDADLSYFILNGLQESFKPIKLIIENDDSLKLSEIISKLCNKPIIRYSHACVLLL
jgi:gag-polypeptide of LTR copia-type